MTPCTDSCSEKVRGEKNGVCRVSRAANAVTGAVKQFSTNTNTLTKLVGSVKSGRQDAELRGRVHELIEQNKQLAKKTSTDLKRMAGMRSPDAREQQARRAAQSKLTQDFQTWMQKFQEVATLDLNKERKEAQDGGGGGRPGPSPQKGSGAFPGLGAGDCLLFSLSLSLPVLLQGTTTRGTGAGAAAGTSGRR